jgi:hypothetical protein
MNGIRVCDVVQGGFARAERLVWIVRMTATRMRCSRIVGLRCFGCCRRTRFFRLRMCMTIVLREADGCQATD